jgi:hypothetical protein
MTPNAQHTTPLAGLREMLDKAEQLIAEKYPAFAAHALHELSRRARDLGLELGATSLEKLSFPLLPHEDRAPLPAVAADLPPGLAEDTITCDCGVTFTRMDRRNHVCVTRREEVQHGA